MFCPQAQGSTQAMMDAVKQAQKEAGRTCEEAKSQYAQVQVITEM
jgi:hypothetical protein